jgi:hypothetical protein
LACGEREWQWESKCHKSFGVVTHSDIRSLKLIAAKIYCVALRNERLILKNLNSGRAVKLSINQMVAEIFHTTCRMQNISHYLCISCRGANTHTHTQFWNISHHKTNLLIFSERRKNYMEIFPTHTHTHCSARSQI